MPNKTEFFFLVYNKQNMLVDMQKKTMFQFSINSEIIEKKSLSFFFQKLISSRLTSNSQVEDFTKSFRCDL